MKYGRRYERNRNTISEEEQQLLQKKAVCVIGCGGLGGGVLEGLARVGVGRITAVDYDAFDETNLNRQIISKEENIGQSKAAEAVKRIASVNSEVEATAVEAKLTRETGAEIIRGHDLVIDALDNIDSRLMLEKLCADERIMLVHGAIAGWRGQVAVISPDGEKILAEIYGDESQEGSDHGRDNAEAAGGSENKGEETVTGTPAFTPACVSSIEVAEAVKVLLGRSETLMNKLLMVDLLNYDFEIIDFGEDSWE